MGKGQGDRIFKHVNGALSAQHDEDAADLKSQRIKEIKAAGLDVAQLIHRHNIEDQQVAFQIEGAVIDAYPGLTNIVSGHGAGDYGCRNVEQIVSKYTSQLFKAREPLILISIAHTYKEEGRSIYDAVRYAWNIDVNRAKKFNLVLAHYQGLVVGAFRPKKWLVATRANFCRMAEDDPTRWGFVGKDAGKRAESIYNRKLVPDKYRGNGNPIRYVELPVKAGK